MSNSPLCHFLIGPPGSGKSTLAAQMLAAELGQHIVSTDQIRQQLLGDEASQEQWPDVEAAVFAQITAQAQAGRSVIYDATNAKRPRRIDLLQKLAHRGIDQWVGWQVKTPLARCQERNMNRSRQVPPDVIQEHFQALQHFPPVAAEGFVNVYAVPEVNGQVDLKAMVAKLKALSRSQVNRENRTKNITPHRYSRLLDFDRLLHLIVLILKYPGLGSLHRVEPTTLKRLLNLDWPPTNPIEEICALMQQLYDPLYADPTAIAADLQWLENNHLIGEGTLDPAMAMPPDPDTKLPLNPHTYSDWEPFQRLLSTIRFIAHHPFYFQSDQGSLMSLIEGLQQAGTYTTPTTLRKDIEEVLKPYRILPENPLKRGYCIGTALLSNSDLMRVFRLLKSQVKLLQDPLDFLTYEKFEERLLTYSKFCEAGSLPGLNSDDIYPIRAIRNQMVLDLEKLPTHVLARNLDRLERAIETGELLELNRVPGGGRFAGDERDVFFLAWPLQIVFYNRSWHLAYEQEDPKQGNLFRFERLDRLFTGTLPNRKRGLVAQQRSLAQLMRLYDASFGIYLGRSAADQQDFLSNDPVKRRAIEVKIHLWFDPPLFKFIKEGQRRFKKMKLQPDKTGDPNFPNLLQIELPRWCLDDVDFHRWIMAYAEHVRVVKPASFAQKFAMTARKMYEVYWQSEQPQQHD